MIYMNKMKPQIKKTEIKKFKNKISFNNVK